MVGQPKVVVEEITDDLALCLAKHMVPVQFPAARPFRKIEKAHARVSGDELGGNRARDLRDTVANDEDLDVANGLVQRRGDRIAKRFSVCMRRNQYGGGRTAASRRDRRVGSHPRQQQGERTASFVGEPPGLVEQLPDITQRQPEGHAIHLVRFADVDDAVAIRVLIEPAPLLRLATFRDDPSLPVRTKHFSGPVARLYDKRRGQLDLFVQACFGPRTKQEMQDTAQTPANKVHAPLAAAVENRLVPRRDFATLDRDTNLADAQSPRREPGQRPHH